MNKNHYYPLTGTGYPRVYRPNTQRLVNPISELNRLVDRIEELEQRVAQQAMKIASVCPNCGR